jgi:hypothetical protein
MQSPVAWRQNQQRRQQVVCGQNVGREFCERSLEREHVLSQSFLENVQDLTALIRYNMEMSSVREKAFRAFLNSGKDLQPDFHDHQ